METVDDSSWISHAFHGPGYSGDTPIAHRAYFPNGADVNNYHIYTVNWTPIPPIFKVDNVVTYTVK